MSNRPIIWNLNCLGEWDGEQPYLILVATAWVIQNIMRTLEVRRRGHKAWERGTVLQRGLCFEMRLSLRNCLQLLIYREGDASPGQRSPESDNSLHLSRYWKQKIHTLPSINTEQLRSSFHNSKIFRLSLAPSASLHWQSTVSYYAPKSGHMPGLWARSPVGVTREAMAHWCFSPSLSPSLPLSLKIN